MASEKNYFYKKESEFSAFVSGQTPSASLKDAAENVANLVNHGELEITAADPIVIFERTNTVRFARPRPVTSGLIVESNRRLGTRVKKEKPATETKTETPSETASVETVSEGDNPVENTKHKRTRT